MNTSTKKHKKITFAVFAHPDDEAFGPAGTLAKLSTTNDVYLLCATNGEKGKGPNNLSKIRQKELLASAKILGIKKVFFLGFGDGTLNNSLYHKLAAKIEKLVKNLKPSTIITYEPLGISGHIDHITVSLVTTYVAKKFSFIKKIMYHCVRFQEADAMRNYFIFHPPGFYKEQIDEVVNISKEWEQKKQAILCHKSQVADINKILARLEKLPKEEYFLYSIKRG